MLHRGFLAIALALMPAFAAADLDDWTPFEIVDGEFVVDITLNGIATKAALEPNALDNSISRIFLDKHSITYDERTTYSLSFMGETLEIARPRYIPGDPPIALRLHPWFKIAPVQQIDYANRRMRYVPRKAVDLYRKDNLKLRGGSVNSTNPAADIRIGGKKFHVAIAEPRASYTTVSRRLAIENGWLDAFALDREALGRNAADLQDYDFMRVPNARFGPFEFDYLVVMAAKDSAHADHIVTNLDGLRSDTRFFDGVLGLDVLENFVVTLDPHRRKAHVYVP